MLEEIMDAVYSSMSDPEAREPSPVAGEGRRVGGSSHIGSSSSFTAIAQAHRVGGGVSTVQTGLRHVREATPDEDDPPNSFAVTSQSNSERPPSYTSAPADDETRMQYNEDSEASDFPINTPHHHQSWNWGDVPRGGMFSQTMAAPPSPNLEGEDYQDDNADTNSNRAEIGDQDDLMADQTDTDEPFSQAAFSGPRAARANAPSPLGADHDDEDLPVVKLHGADSPGVD